MANKLLHCCGPFLIFSFGVFCTSELIVCKVCFLCLVFYFVVPVSCFVPRHVLLCSCVMSLFVVSCHFILFVIYIKCFMFLVYVIIVLLLVKSSFHLVSCSICFAHLVLNKLHLGSNAHLQWTPFVALYLLLEYMN